MSNFVAIHTGATATWQEERRSGPSFSAGGATASRTGQTAGANIKQVLADVFDATFYSGVGFTVRKRASHPDFDWMLADTVNFEPWDKPEDPPATGTDYDWLRCTINYKGEPLEANRDPENDPDTPEGTTLSHDREGSVEMMTIPNSGFVWATSGDPLPADVDTGIKIPTTTHRLQWSNVSAPPFAAIRLALGGINTDAFFGAAAETLMFTGYSTGITYDGSGSEIYTVEYQFIERRITSHGANGVGWNHLFDPTARIWDRIKNAMTNSTETFQLVDFEPLFQLAAA